MQLQELMTYTRQRTNTENSQIPTDTELMWYLNQALASLDLTLCTDYEDYNLTKFLCTLGSASNSTTAMIGGNNNLIPLPPDFFKLRAVDFGSPGAWITIYGYGLQQRNRFNNPYSNMLATYGNQVTRRARVMDQYIVIEPLNLCSGQYQVWYTPKYHPLKNPTDQIPVTMDTEGFIEYAVASAGVKIYNKLVLPSQGFMEEMAYYEDKVRNGAKNRMSMGPQCVQNVRNRGGGWGFGRNFGSY